ncbi:hypothetical protein T459_20811 [Capsicum annuum]|uniref:Uncharacterized protein n=1 Tax=Capsicum annuum TaxID=4072 RepID=A0A2G2Z5N6_CAPAN|nr:hypothetical protein T459_20811 [Capsicum annuum]
MLYSKLLLYVCPLMIRGSLKILKTKYENHPEVFSERLELRAAQEELERYSNFFDLGERDVLLEEIQKLRSQLPFYLDFSPKSSWKENSLLQLTYPFESRLHSGLQHLEGINAAPARLTASTSRFSTRWESTRPVIFTGKPLEDDRIRVEGDHLHLGLCLDGGM